MTTRRGVAAAALLGLVLLTVAWWAWRRVAALEPAQSAPVPVLAASAASAARATVAEVHTSSPPTAPASAPQLALAAPAASATRSAASAASTARDDDRLEVCGHGRLHAHDVARLLPEEVQFETQGRLVASLARGGERERVVGLLLGMGLAADIAQAGDLHACGGDFTCLLAQGSPRQARQRQAVETLVQTAQGSPDPWVYAAVVSYACSYEATGACVALTPEAWQQRAPDDAAPWLWAVALSHSRKDAAAVDTAWAQAVSKTRLSDPWGTLLGPLLALPEMRALTPLARMHALVGPIGVQSRTFAPMAGVVSSCSETGLVAAGRRERCDAPARLFVEQAPTMLHLGIGRRLGERLGWPAEKQSALNAELRELQQLGPAAMAPEALISCQSIATLESYFAEVAALGEVGALRKRRADRAAPAPGTGAAASAPPTK